MHMQTPKERAFVRNATDSPRTIAAMTVCTGVNILASAGALVGHNATAPYILYPLLEKQHPTVHWSQARWVRTAEGKLWTSGSIGNGLDMVAAFMREYFWDRPELVELVLAAAAVGDRGREYSEREMKVFASYDFSKHLKMHEQGDLGMAGMNHGGMGGMDHGGMAGMNHGM
jgi:transcriptional regulator GlxA family with amidase domain